MAHSLVQNATPVTRINLVTLLCLGPHEVFTAGELQTVGHIFGYCPKIDGGASDSDVYEPLAG